MQLTPEQVKGRIKNVAKGKQGRCQNAHANLHDGVTFEVKEVSISWMRWSIRVSGLP